MAVFHNKIFVADMEFVKFRWNIVAARPNKMQNIKETYQCSMNR